MPDTPRPRQKSIVLVGLMGAGKSTVGRQLAERLGLLFHDSDAEIEASEGLSVAGIFERHGEAHFRTAERRIVAELVAGPAGVIAAGGGAFIDPETRALLLSRCFVIWLDGDLETLAERAARGGGRPLLDSFASLAEARRPIYAEAHLRVESDDSALAAIVEALP
jgi:shikimate kinase